MCIIAIKMPGAELDSIAVERLRNCIANNPDGSGFMWTGGKNVHIRKGYWDLASMLGDIYQRGLDVPNKLVVLHFRIATAGTVCDENCHPFPLTASKGDLRATRIRTNVGIAHNGILDVPTKGKYSDTQLFIKDFLAPLGPDKLRDPSIVSLLEMSGSKFVILHGDGQMLTVGSFYQEGQWFYSNIGYKHVFPTPGKTNLPYSLSDNDLQDDWDNDDDYLPTYLRNSDNNDDSSVDVLSDGICKECGEMNADDDDALCVNCYIKIHLPISAASYKSSKKK